LARAEENLGRAPRRRRRCAHRRGRDALFFLFPPFPKSARSHNPQTRRNIITIITTTNTNINP
jgi:hypothetical protein